MFKTEEEKLLPGEKLEGIGFMVFLIAGAGLDGTDWIASFCGVLLGIILMGIGTKLVKKEKEEEDTEYM